MYILNVISFIRKATVNAVRDVNCENYYEAIGFLNKAITIQGNVKPKKGKIYNCLQLN